MRMTIWDVQKTSEPPDVPNFRKSACQKVESSEVKEYGEGSVFSSFYHVEIS